MTDARACNTHLDFGNILWKEQIILLLLVYTEQMRGMVIFQDLLRSWGGGRETCNKRRITITPIQYTTGSTFTHALYRSILCMKPRTCPTDTNEYLSLLHCFVMVHSTELNVKWCHRPPTNPPLLTGTAFFVRLWSNIKDNSSDTGCNT